jgi:hypothetical protein
MRSIEFGGSTMQGEVDNISRRAIAPGFDATRDPQEPDASHPEGTRRLMADVPTGAATAAVSNWRRRLLDWSVLLATVTIGGLILCAIGIWRFGSLSHALKYAQGYSVIPESSVITLGNVESGSRVTGRIRLLNLTGSPVRVTGAESSCGCIAYEDLPIDVPPHGSTVMSAWFKAPKITSNDAYHFTSDVSHAIRLILDVESPSVEVRINAKAIPTPEKIAIQLDGPAENQQVSN